MATQKRPGTANVKQPIEVKPSREADFDFLIRSKLVPKMLECRAYGGAKMGVHRYDGSCHTKLPYSADKLLPHIKSCGGGFKVKVAQARGAWKGWKDLGEIPGLIIADFRCGVCEQVLAHDHAAVLSHMNNHLNTHRRIEKGGAYLITLAFEDKDAPIFIDPEDELDDVELIDIDQ